ncbi:serine/threonine-protein kinase [Streptomyces sp. RGM 3693]|uniref:serine/threonine-protein kinase n=1 Tax=Streptomyces sp. RGM 3693 TaxID=3413284 RepID=UPI003D2D6E81
MSSGSADDQGDDIEGVQPLKASDPPRIGPYLLLGRLGAGGMGRVYLARSEGGRTVAVKVVHEEHVADAQFRARFRREIDAARRVGERHTAPVLDADPDADQPWVATGYVPGLSLEQIVRHYGPLPVASVTALADGLLRALKDIHAAGIIHRDLKPSNVMLTVKGPRVIDFGIARALETSVESLLTSTGLIVGSPGFMSPEQILGGDLGPRSDVFALGCVLGYAATGQLAFGNGVTNPHAVNYHCVESEPDLDRVPDASLRALIARCLTKDVADRPDVDALLDDPDRARPAPVGGSWLPPEIVAHLAERAAHLLDVDAVPLREQPTDLATVDLRPKDAPDPTPQPDPPKGKRKGKGKGKGKAGDPGQERRAGKRPWPLVVPMVAVVVVGGGTAVLLLPGDGGHRADASPPGASSSNPPHVNHNPRTPPSSSPPPGTQSPSPSPSPSAGTNGGGAPLNGGSGGGSGGGPGGGSGSGSGASGGTTTGGGSGSSGGSSGGGTSGGSGSSGSSGSTSSGGTSGGGAVPSYFLGSWSYPAMTNQPQKITVYRAAVGQQAARFVSDMPYTGHCETVARLEGVKNGGSRIELTSAAVDTAHSKGICQAGKASILYVAAEGGLYHLDDPSEGQGYHYTR